MNKMSVTDVYDFCLDWQMAAPNTRWSLVSKFVFKEWDFLEFKNIAQEYNWYVLSMDCLGELDEPQSNLQAACGGLTQTAMEW